MGANPHRGDVTVPLKGGAVTLRPSFEALSAIEVATGQGFYNLTMRLSAGQVSVRHLAAVVSAAAVPPLSVDKAGAAITETGMMAVYPAVLEFCTKVVTACADPATAESPDQDQGQDPDKVPFVD